MFVNKVYLEFIHTHIHLFPLCFWRWHTYFWWKHFTFSKYPKSLLRGKLHILFRFKRSRELREELFVCEDKQFSEMNGWKCYQYCGYALYTTSPYPDGPSQLHMWMQMVPELEPEPEQELKMLIETRQDVCAHIIMAWHGYYFHKFQYLLWILVYFSFNTKKISILMQ